MYLNKNFFLKLLALLLFLFTADRLGEKILYSFFSNAKYNQSREINYILNEVKSDVLIFGSSRASHHYIPSIISDSLKLSVYNCGHDGQCIYYHYCLLKMIKERYLPEIIILDLFYSELFVSANANLENIKLLTPFYGNDEDLDSLINSISPFEKYKMTSKLYRYNSKLTDIFIDNFIKTDQNWENGYVPIFDEMKTVKYLKFSSVEQIVEQGKISYLEKFITFCKENNIKLLLCVSPVHYICEDKEGFIPAQKIAEKHDVPILDHYCNSSFSKNNSLFKDETHLNHNGATIFSSIIRQEIKSYLTDN